MSYSLVQGDLEPDMEIDVTAVQGGAPVNLSGAIQLQLRWRKPDKTDSLVNLVAIDLVNGRVKRVWVTGDSDQIGLHKGQVVVTESNGEIATYPNDGSYVLWYVYPQL